MPCKNDLDQTRDFL